MSAIFRRFDSKKRGVLSAPEIAGLSLGVLGLEEGSEEHEELLRHKGALPLRAFLAHFAAIVGADPLRARRIIEDQGYTLCLNRQGEDAKPEYVDAMGGGGGVASATAAAAAAAATTAAAAAAASGAASVSARRAAAAGRGSNSTRRLRPQSASVTRAAAAASRSGRRSGSACGGRRTGGGGGLGAVSAVSSVYSVSSARSRFGSDDDYDADEQEGGFLGERGERAALLGLGEDEDEEEDDRADSPLPRTSGIGSTPGVYAWANPTPRPLGKRGGASGNARSRRAAGKKLVATKKPQAQRPASAPFRRGSNSASSERKENVTNQS